PLRQLQRRSREERVPHGPVASLRTAHANDLWHPLQLFDAGAALQRSLFRADPQLSASLLAAALSLWRIARGVLDLRRRPRARPRAAERRHALSAARDVATHGPVGLPERGAVFACGELQQPGKLWRIPSAGADTAVSGLRGDRH